MKTLKYYLGFVIFVIFLNNLYSQNDLNLKFGRINTTNGEKIKVKNLTFEDNQFKYKSYQKPDIEYMNLDNILKVEQKQGSHALEFGLGLGVAALLGGLIGTSNRYYRENPDIKRTYLISVSAAGLGIGIVWGLTQPKYKTVYINPKYGQLNGNLGYPVYQNYYTAKKSDIDPRYK